LSTTALIVVGVNWSLVTCVAHRFEVSGNSWNVQKAEGSEGSLTVAL
jgi:hypothetical protein